MEVIVVRENGYEEALYGISLSYNADYARMPNVAKHLALLDGGHNKFLESIQVWIDIDAPRYWWSQFDTYRVGVSKQSESTMHTLTKRPLTQDDFEDYITPIFISTLNSFITNGDLTSAKAHLPEAFLQKRLVCTNYKALRGIVAQRATHKLPQWKCFISSIKRQLSYPEFLTFNHEGRRNHEG